MKYVNSKNTRTTSLTAIRYLVKAHGISSLNIQRKAINTFSSFFMKPFFLCFFVLWQQSPFTFELTKLSFSSSIVCLLGTCSKEFKNPSDQSSKSLFKFPGEKHIHVYIYITEDSIFLTLLSLLSTKRSHILKQTYSFQLSAACLFKYL